MSKNGDESGVDSFLEEVTGKKTVDPLTENESDPFDTVVSGTKDEGTTDEVVRDEKSVPFHKDPKIQRFIEKEISKRLKDYQVSSADAQTPQQQQSAEDELTESLIEIIGNDTPQKIEAIKRFRQRLGRLEERGAERALEQIREQSLVEQQEEQEAFEELSSAFDNLEEEFGVDLTSNTVASKKERVDFINFIERISPKDSDGNPSQFPDISEAYRLFKGTRKPADNTRAKDLASRSMARSTDASSTPSKGGTWKDVDKMLARLN